MGTKTVCAWRFYTSIYGFVSLFTGICQADIVYTTGTGGGPSSNNVKNPTTGYSIGILPAGNTGMTLGFRGSPTQYPIIKFTTGSSAPAWQFNGINLNLYFDGHSGSGATTLTSGTINWELFQGGTSLGTFTQALKAMTHPSGIVNGPNVYQDNPFSSSINLSASTEYALIMNSITNIAIDQLDDQNSSIHWTNYDSAPTSGQEFAVNFSTSVGWYNSPPYNGTNSINTSNNNYAFDINATAVPEPGTLALGTLAMLGGVGGWWCRKKQPPQPSI